MNAQQHDAFARLWALGYHRLCPIIPPLAPISERSSLFKRLARGDDARGKMPGIRWPDGTWSGFDFVAHESTEADLLRWHAMGAGVGIKTGHGLALIDADTLNPQHAATIRAAVEQHFGHLPLRIGRAPKAGYLVRVEGEFQYARVEFGERDAKGRLKDRVEVLYEGRQFVAHGIHPDTGKPYSWPDGVPALADVPTVPAASLLAFLEALRPLLPATGALVKEGATTAVNQDNLRGPPDRVREAVAATPNTSELFPTRESYRDMGYAIRAAVGPEHEAEGLAIFEDWCARWTDGHNEPDVVAADWRRMKPPYRRGASWLYELAERHGGGAFSTASAWLEEAGTEPLFPDEPPAEKRAAIMFTPFAEAAETALSVAAKPLVKGLLDQGAMTVLYGASNTGKTFVAMDMAFHIAAGLAWGGMKVTPGFHVVYVAAEGGIGARKRAAALRRKYGSAADGRFHFLLAPVDLFRADADLHPLIAAIAALGVPVGLVVIDTLSRAMAGGDENASTDMGALVKHLDALRKASGAHLLAVHHSGKDAMKGARGWSGLRAATDTEIEIIDGQIAVRKQRDLDQEWTAAFFLDVVELGRDEDGDPVTSCTVRLEVAEPGRPVAVGPVGPPTQREAGVLEAMRAVQSGREDGVVGMTVSDILAYLGEDTDKAAQKAMGFHILALHKKRLIRRIVRGRYSITDESKENAPLLWVEGQAVQSDGKDGKDESKDALFE